MEVSLPTLTTDGFVNNKRLIFYKLWEYFLVNQYSQSNTYKGSIASLGYIIGSGSSPTGVAENVEKTLKDLYLRYFDVANVRCEADLDDGTNTYYMQIGLEAYDESDPDTVFSLVKEIEGKNGEIKNLDTLLSELYKHYVM